MAEAATGTGTVTSLSSVFPPEEAHKAARRVEDEISERLKELDRLNEFIADNNGLISLVQKLPDELHHDIMVPFGKAAFFPGRLINTNEFMVLLGEGYYAKRSSKQTVEILRRRGKALDANVESLESMIKDFRAEALFFDSTATEVAEGLVEIREEIPDERESSEKDSVDQGFRSISISENAEASDEDDTYARLMSRLDELEKEEQSAEAAERNAETDSHDGNEVSDSSISHEKLKPEPHLPETPSWSVDEHSKHGGSLIHNHAVPNTYELLDLEDCTSTHIPEDANLHVNNSVLTLQSSSNQEHNLMPKETTTSLSTLNDQVPSQQLPLPPRRADTSKAFTGSVIERAPNFQVDHRDPSTASSQVPNSLPSKPVSRFKLQSR